MKTYLWLPLSCLNVAVAILLRKVSVAAVSSFAFNAAKLSTNLSFYLPFFPQQNEMIPAQLVKGYQPEKRSYVCFVIKINLTS